MGRRRDQLLVSSGSLDVVDVFYDHVYNLMPAHLLHISDSGVRLIHREDLHRLFLPNLAEHAAGGGTFKTTEREAFASFVAGSTRGVNDDGSGLAGAANGDTGDNAAALPPKDLVARRLKYAILSHRWSSEGEATFQTVLENGILGDAPGCEKLRRFCAAAAALGCTLAWADTCCIDKASSAELDEAIRSMFKWYRNSAVCIVLLAKTTAGMTAGRLQNCDEDEENSSMRDDPWFTRGWTLQELLAPATVKFYGADWLPLSDFHNDKDNAAMMHVISNITGIDRRSLRYFSPGLLNVREKMLWASSRKTTRVEDVAYSLLGIFDISMPIAYGEGKRAFRRLMEAIVSDCREWQVFAWAGPHSPYAASLPESPLGYHAFKSAHATTPAALLADPGRPVNRPWEVGYPFYAMTKKGLELDVFMVEMMLHIRREPGFLAVGGDGLTFSPGSENRRFFEDVRVVCDTRFLLFSQWAVGIINYQTDGTGDREGMVELEAGRDYVCFLLGTGIYSPYRKWEKVETREVVTIHTKEVLRKRVTTVWL